MYASSFREKSVWRPGDRLSDIPCMQVVFSHLFLFKAKCPSNVPALSRQKGTTDSIRIKGSPGVCSFVPPFFNQRVYKKRYIYMCYTYKRFPE